jgi:beta-lactamase class A
MPSNRRSLLTTGLASATLGTAFLGAAGCVRRVNSPIPAAVRGLDFGRLAHGFAPLAARAAPGVFNLGVMTLDTLAVWSADDDRRFPMQGLVMAPIAAAALAEVDAGRLRLNDIIRVRNVDLSPPPSRIALAFPLGSDKLDLPVADLIALAVQDGDNTAGDAVMAHIGGPGAVTAWLRGRNIKEIRVDRYQREVLTDMFGMASFRAAWKDAATFAAARASVPPAQREAAMAAFLADPRDTTSASGALNFLDSLSAGELLSHASTRLLMALMSSTTGPRRLAAGLPPKAALSQVSGTSPTDLGLTQATNDMGLAALPDGRRLAIVAFLAGSTATAAQRDGLIAEAARLAISALR